MKQTSNWDLLWLISLIVASMVWVLLDDELAQLNVLICQGVGIRVPRPVYKRHELGAFKVEVWMCNPIPGQSILERRRGQWKLSQCGVSFHFVFIGGNTWSLRKVRPNWPRDTFQCCEMNPLIVCWVALMVLMDTMQTAPLDEAVWVLGLLSLFKGKIRCEY